jgi:hypothetical protein
MRYRTSDTCAQVVAAMLVSRSGARWKLQISDSSR